MYCQKCGAQISDDSAYCRVCGTKVNIENDRQNTSYINNPGRSKQKKKNSLASWIALFFSLVWCFGLFYIAATKNKMGAEPNSENESERQTQLVSLSFGDSYSCDGLDFTVKSIVFSKYAGNLNNLNPAGSDYVYLVVYADVENTTSEKIELTSQFLSSYTSDYSFKIVYDGSASYNQSYAEYADFLFANQEILPLATLTNKVLNYKVPVAVQSSEAPIVLRLTYKSNVCAEWKLR